MYILYFADLLVFNFDIMNYQILKSIFESILQNFKCPACESKIWESNLEIIWAAGSTVNLNIICPSCWRHSFIKAEISQINLSNFSHLTKDKLIKMKEFLQGNVSNENKNKSISINEKEIIDLKNLLNQSHIWVNDLLNP